jgi:hypothetical protein
METQYNEKHQMKSFPQHHKENISTTMIPIIKAKAIFLPQICSKDDLTTRKWFCKDDIKDKMKLQKPIKKIIQQL